MDEYPNGTNAVVAVIAYTGELPACNWVSDGKGGPEQGVFGDSCSLTRPPPPDPFMPCNAAAGYDMEDAMILNKASVDRGFAHASIYKSSVIDLREERGKYVQKREKRMHTPRS